MKLNVDCCRSILLAVEEQELGQYFTGPMLFNKLSNYSPEDITYCCVKLDEAGLLDVLTTHTLSSRFPEVMEVKDITYYGHQFLENIHKEESWSKVKITASKVGSFSLEVLKEIAKQVALSEIPKLL